MALKAEPGNKVWNPIFVPWATSTHCQKNRPSIYTTNERRDRHLLIGEREHKNSSLRRRFLSAAFCEIIKGRARSVTTVTLQGPKLRLMEQLGFFSFLSQRANIQYLTLKITQFLATPARHFQIRLTIFLPPGLFCGRVKPTHFPPIVQFLGD